MQSKQIKGWVKANKLLSAIIVGVIIVAIILYLGVAKQVPKTGEQKEEAVVETPSEGAVETPIAPTEEVTAPAKNIEGVPTEAIEGPTETKEKTTEGGTP